MMRKFKFEAEVYESLNCLPMAARRKLDALGIKLHLAQWEQLGRGERLMICHAPADSEEEQSALRTFIEEVAMARMGSPAKILPAEAPRSANARSLERTYTLALYRNDLRQLIQRDPQTACQIYRALAGMIGDRLRLTNELMETEISKEKV